MIATAADLRQVKPVDPFFERGVVEGMSFGLSLAGYDVRVAQSFWLWPGRFKLASTIEKFLMPTNPVGVVHDKSTWARRGVAVQNTVIEPGWTGYLTLELTNHSWWPIRIQAGMPIAQILFHYTNGPCDPYTGKYQNQEAGPQEARFEND